MQLSSACGLTHDFLLVFRVARVSESHAEPGRLGWATVLMALEEEGSENDTSYRQTRTSA